MTRLIDRIMARLPEWYTDTVALIVITSCATWLLVGL